MKILISYPLFVFKICRFTPKFFFTETTEAVFCTLRKVRETETSSVTELYIKLELGKLVALYTEIVKRKLLKLAVPLFLPYTGDHASVYKLNEVVHESMRTY